MIHTLIAFILMMTAAPSFAGDYIEVFLDAGFYGERADAAIGLPASENSGGRQAFGFHPRTSNQSVLGNVGRPGAFLEEMDEWQHRLRTEQTVWRWKVAVTSAQLREIRTYVHTFGLQAVMYQEDLDPESPASSFTFNSVTAVAKVLQLAQVQLPVEIPASGKAKDWHDASLKYLLRAFNCEGRFKIPLYSLP